MTETWRYPEAIVQGAWLEANLNEPNLRIYDCTTYLRYEEDTGRPYRVESGRADWEAGHIPGSVYLDLQVDFSEDAAPTRFMRLTPVATAAAFARFGVGPDTRVILYARKSPQWATRFWWMLRWIGFDNAAVLDGGMDAWELDRRPVVTASSDYPSGSLTAAPRPDMFVDKQDMLAAITDSASCSLNALSGDLHAGANPRYGRAGRIPGSTNVPATSLIDPERKTFLPPDLVAAALRRDGTDRKKRILNYCGGGIAATLDAFLQYQLGYRDTAVYDASMSEWAMDNSLPIETDSDL